jgi:uncharacterized protein (DUF433 family)
MQLEDYFEFNKVETKFGPAEEIRIKGHRIFLEHVIRPYKEGVSAEVIWRDYYPSLTKEEVDATINYYVQHKAEIDAYMQRGDEIEDRFYKEYSSHEPPPVVKRLREIKAKQELERSQGHA